MKSSLVLKKYFRRFISKIIFDYEDIEENNQLKLILK